VSDPHRREGLEAQLDADGDLGETESPSFTALAGIIGTSWLQGACQFGYPFVYREPIAVGWHCANTDGIGLVGNKERTAFARLAIACATLNL
jgi:hypothetical protein